MLSIKSKIEAIRAKPKEFYDREINKLSYDKEKESIEDLLCLLFAGSAILQYDTFRKISTQILEYPSFEEKPEYQFYYFICRGSFFHHLKEIQFALDCYGKANRISYLINEPEYIIKSLSFLSLVYIAVKDLEMSLNYIEQSLKLLDNVKNPILMATTYSNYAMTLQQMGELHRAKEVYEKSFEYFNEVNDFKNHLSYCITLLNLGDLYLLMGDLDSSEREYFQGISIAESNDFSEYLGNHLLQIAEVYHEKGRDDKAYLYLKKYNDKQSRANTIQRKVDSADEKEKLKEELSTLFILRKENQNLHKRINSLADSFDKNEKLQNEKKITFTEIGEALENHEIVAYFQPKWSLSKQMFTGAEALARWVKNDGTIIYPDSFIKEIEDSVLIHLLSKQIIKQSFQFCSIIKSTIYKDFVISINIAPYELKTQNVVALLEREILLHDLKPSNIEIEITERTFLDNNRKAMEQLYKMKDLGFKIALDDFGVGYSSISFLNRIPFDTVKIDRSLMINATTIDNGMQMLSGIINLIHDMGFHIIMEGVETKAQENLLKDFNCDETQGFYYSKPISRDQILSLLNQKVQVNR